jgi:tetratricopeptide (TPR) repeat protein
LLHLSHLQLVKLTKQKTIFIGLLTILSVSFSAYSQAGPDPGLAKYYYKKGNYPEAIRIYNQVLKTEGEDAQHNYYIGLCYLKSEINPQKALQYFNLAYNQSKRKKTIPFYLAMAHMHHLNYTEAKSYFYEYSKDIFQILNFKLKKEAKRMILLCDDAKYLLAQPVDVEIVNLGDKINTEYPDYYPYFFEKDSTLFFTTRRPKKGTGLEFDGLYQSDIFYAVLKEDGFELAKEMDKINTKLDEQMAGLSSNRNIYIYIDHINEYGNIQEFVEREPNTYRRNKDFVVLSNPKELTASVYISKDGSKIYYSSNAKGSKGGYDIFYREKLSTTGWSVPKSLNINTPYDEGFPLLSPDEKTLYFCSNGLLGMGGFDLYKSEWNDATKTWEEPVNLGYPINTPSDEKFIWFMSDMKSAFISGYRKEGFGYSDIYKVIFK